MRRFKSPGETTEALARRHTSESDICTAPAISARSDAILSQSAGRIKIGFVGLSAGAGTTTLAFAAAEYLAALLRKRKSKRLITLLELDLRQDAPAGRPYDKIGIDRRFAGRDFTSIYHLASEGKPLHGIYNIDSGINFMLRLPGNPCPALSLSTLHRLTGNVSGDIIVCDVSSYGFFTAGADATGRNALLALLSDMTCIICVLDPLPSRLLASVTVAEVCRAAASEIPVTYAFNKLNSGVNLREVTRYTGIHDYISFPAVPFDTVYEAEFACRSLASYSGIKTALAAVFNI